MFKNNYRWEMMAWLFVIVLISYFDRINFAIAAPPIMKEFGINAGRMGIIMSGFTIGYALMNFAGGFLAERYSARKFMTFIIFLWSAMTFLTSLGSGFVSLLIIRIVFGICEGPMVLIITKLVKRWMLPKERAIASGLWLSAMPIGTMIGVVLSGIIVSNYGWRSVFYIFGVAGFIMAALNWFILHDKPQEHPSITKDELESIETSIAKYDGEETLSAQGSSFVDLIKNPAVLVICGVYIIIPMFLWGNLNWLPTYFVQARGSSLLQSGIYSAMPFLGATLGPLVLGWLSDRRILIRMRASWVCLALFVMVPTVLIAVSTESLIISLVCFTIACFFDMAAMGMMFTLVIEIFEKANVAKVTGMMLGSGTIGGIIAPILMGYVLQATNSFNIAYYIFAAIALIGGLLSIFIIRKEKQANQLKSLKTVSS